MRLGRVVALALASRGAVLLAMAISDGLFPDHNPGDDVLRFPLSSCREQCNSHKGKTDDDAMDPPTVSQFCQPGQACERLFMDVPHLQYCEQSFLQEMYVFLLRPLTKWDSARFLHLAIDPGRRIPQVSLATRRYDDNDSVDSDKVDPFVASEEAHAFFPMFPWLVRALSLVMIRHCPLWLLPCSYAGVSVLAAFLVNTMAFCVAAVALWDMTKRNMGQSTAPESCEPCIDDTVVWLFCCNPANVFFVAAYSESTFCCWTFVGYALFNRGQWFVATLFWIMASATRSNGTMVAGWLILYGVSTALALCPLRQSQRLVCSVAAIVAMTVGVIMPALWHDQRGYSFHCLSDRQLRPLWCNDGDGRKVRSVYALVQQKHWNVGFFRYYELKQLPNFLLATPVFVYSYLAVRMWIMQSLERYRKKQDNKANGLNSLTLLLRWAIFALKEAHPTKFAQAQTNKTNHAHSNYMDNRGVLVLLGAQHLGHYVVLAGVALLGLIIAHVQISTRLICSTCPAVYWYMAYISERNSTKDDQHKQQRTWVLHKSTVLLYFVGFNIAGILLHPNFLPWT